MFSKKMPVVNKYGCEQWDCCPEGNMHSQCEAGKHITARELRSGSYNNEIDLYRYRYRLGILDYWEILIININDMSID